MIWAIALMVSLVIAIACHDFFTGRKLLRDCVREFRIYRADINALDAFCQSNSDRTQAIVSLTSIPSRMPMIEDTLKSLLGQTRSPAEIRVYLPKSSRRESKPYIVPKAIANLQSVKIIRVEDDLGPATKFIHALNGLGPDDKLIVVDDDRIFPDNMIALLDDAANQNPDSAFCIGGWVVPADLTDRRTDLWMYLRRSPPAQVRPVRIRLATPIDILMGAHGFMVRPKFINLERLNDYSDAPEAAVFADDIWISAYCRAPKYALPCKWADFQPYRHVPSYDRTSIGWINRRGRPEQWVNSITLKHLGMRPWLCGRTQRDA